ncbi:MAG: hypothetical protein ACPGWR_19790, partial [Ardenticatenaceae bacterium]
MSRSKSKSKKRGQSTSNSSNGWQQSEAGQQLQERLTNEHTLLALTRLLDRIDGLEQTVQTLVTAIEQGPGFVSMVADTVDETYRQATHSGVDIEARLKSGLAMADKLTAPKTVAVLDKLLDRVDQVEQLVEMADQAPGMISMVADTADEAYRQAAESGIDLEGRLKAGLAMADKLTAPETVAVLDKLLSRIGQVGELVEIADQAPGMISMVADTADEAYRQAAESGIDLEGRLKAGLAMADKLTAPETVAVLDKLLSRIGQVGELVEIADQAPGMISMVADTADEAYRQAAESGIDLEGRLKAGLAMADKLTAPETVAVLDKLLSRIGQVGELVEIADQAPGMISMVADTADEAYRQAAESGI